MEPTQDEAERDRLIDEGDRAFAERRCRDALRAYARAGAQDRLKHFAEELIPIEMHHEQVRDAFFLIDDLEGLARMLLYHEDRTLPTCIEDVRRYLRERGFKLRSSYPF